MTYPRHPIPFKNKLADTSARLTAHVCTVPSATVTQAKVADESDAVIPAQFDLSTDLGVSGQFDHPDFQAAIANAHGTANGANIPLGNVAVAKPQAEALFAKGYRIVAGFDIL